MKTKRHLLHRGLGVLAAGITILAAVALATAHSLLSHTGQVEQQQPKYRCPVPMERVR